MNDPNPRVFKLISADGARAEIHPQGAQLTSWIPAGESTSRLFLSRSSIYRPGVTIRGGVPVIFPQFATEGPLPKHGFARTSMWQAVNKNAAASDGTASFRLTDNPATRAQWPHAFEATLTVAIGGARLSMTLSARNTGAGPFTFTAALHTYLSVADIAGVSLRGLQGLRYRDKAAGGGEATQTTGALRIDGEVDRIYFDAPAPVEVLEPSRTTRVEASGFADVVVWNPGAKLAETFTDLEAGGYTRMLCVEAAVIGRPVTLQPGASWSGSQTLIAD